MSDTNRDRFMAYSKGWRHAASYGAVDTELSDHPNPSIREAYLDGWSDGRIVVRNAMALAEKKYDYSQCLVTAMSDLEPRR